MPATVRDLSFFMQARGIPAAEFSHEISSVAFPKGWASRTEGSLIFCGIILVGQSAVIGLESPETGILLMKENNTGKATVNKNERLVSPASPAVDILTPAQLALHRNYLESVRIMKNGLVRAAFYLERISLLRIHRLLGFQKIAAYAAVHGGFTPAQTERFLFLARRLPDYPEIAKALETSELSWGKARIIVTHTDPQDQMKWLELAQSVSTKALAGSVTVGTTLEVTPEQLPTQPPARFVPKLGTDPNSPLRPPANRSPRQVSNIQSEAGVSGKPLPTVHYVTLKFDAEGLAQWNLTLQTSMLRTKSRRKEDTVLAGLAALAMSANTPVGGSPPVLLTIIECPTCGAGTLPTGRGEAPASLALLAAVHCDAIVEDSDATRRHTIPPRIRRQAFKRARYSCQAKSCERTTWLQVHHRRPVAGTGGNSPENLVVLCSGCHRALHEADVAAKKANDSVKV